MNITHQSSVMEVTQAMRSEMETTLERTLFQFKEINTVQVHYSKEGDKYVISATIHGNNFTDSSSNMYNCMGKVADHIFDYYIVAKDKRNDVRQQRNLVRENKHVFTNEPTASTPLIDPVSGLMGYMAMDTILDMEDVTDEGDVFHVPTSTPDYSGSTGSTDNAPAQWDTSRESSSNDWSSPPSSSSWDSSSSDDSSTRSYSSSSSDYSSSSYSSSSYDSGSSSYDSGSSSSSSDW